MHEPPGDFIWGVGRVGGRGGTGRIKEDDRIKAGAHGHGLLIKVVKPLSGQETIKCGLLKGINNILTIHVYWLRRCLPFVL